LKQPFKSVVLLRTSSRELRCSHASLEKITLLETAPANSFTGNRTKAHSSPGKRSRHRVQQSQAASKRSDCSPDALVLSGLLRLSRSGLGSLTAQRSGLSTTTPLVGGEDFLKPFAHACH
jgi:hypothetical protein